MGERREVRTAGGIVDRRERGRAPAAPGERFADTFTLAKHRGLRRAVHAGESSGPEGVRDAIDLLHTERIDHGVRAPQSKTRIWSASCGMRHPAGDVPTSNIALGLYKTVAEHPIEAMRRAGVVVTINTDDPLLFGCDLVGEYELCTVAFGWDEATVAAGRTRSRAPRYSRRLGTHMSEHIEHLNRVYSEAYWRLFESLDEEFDPPRARRSLRPRGRVPRARVADPRRGLP